MITNLVAWVLLGLIIGWIARNRITNRSSGPPFEFLLGAAGAVIAGWAFSAFEGDVATGFSAWSLLFAGLGAVTLLLAWHAYRHSNLPSFSALGHR